MLNRARKERPVDKSTEPDLGVPRNLDKGPEKLVGFRFSNEEAANESTSTAADDLNAMNAMNEAERRREEDRQKRAKAARMNSAAFTNPAESAAAAERQFANPDNSNDVCLRAITEFYGRDALDLENALRDLELVKRTEQSLIVRSQFNTMEITHDFVEYQEEVTTLRSALQGAILMLNNPRSQNEAVEISGGSPREQLLMNLAAMTIGLKVKNPMDLTTLPPELAAEMPALLDELDGLLNGRPQPAAKPAEAPKAAASQPDFTDTEPMSLADDTVEHAVATPVPAKPSARSTSTEGAVDIDFTDVLDDVDFTLENPVVDPNMGLEVSKPNPAPTPLDEVAAMKAQIKPGPAPVTPPPTLTDIVEVGTGPVVRLDKLISKETPEDRANQLLTARFIDAADQPALPVLALPAPAVAAAAAEPSLPDVIIMPGPDAEASGPRAEAQERGITKFPLLKPNKNGGHDVLCP